MNITIKEAYPGELKAKIESTIQALRERAGVEPVCTCGHCSDEISKAVDVTAITKGEQSPFRLIRELEVLKHKQAQAAHAGICETVAEYIEQAINR